MRVPRSRTIKRAHTTIMQAAGKHPERVLASPYLSANQAPWNEGRPTHNSRVHRANWSIGVDTAYEGRKEDSYSITHAHLLTIIQDITIAALHT